MSTLPTEQGTQFIVIVRDDITKSFIEHANLSIERADGPQRIFVKDLGASFTGILRVTLRQGLWRFRFNADGYNEEVVDGIEIAAGTQASVTDYGWQEIESFHGNTVAFPVSMKKVQDGIKVTSTHPFLSDAIFYRQTDVPPEPIGGIKAIQERIKSQMPAKEQTTHIRRSISARAFINKKGEVVRVQTQLHLDPYPDGIVVDAIRNMTFTPARILGFPVSSCLEIELNFDLKPDRGKAK